VRIARSFRVLIVDPEIALGFGWMVDLVLLLAWLVVLNSCYAIPLYSGHCLSFFSVSFQRRLFLWRFLRIWAANINYLGDLSTFDDSHRFKCSNATNKSRQRTRVVNRYSPAKNGF